MIKRLAELKERHAAAPDPACRSALERKITESKGKVGVVLENLRR